MKIFLISVGLAVIIVMIVTARHYVLQAYYRRMNKWLVKEYRRCNVLMEGKKGDGKDALTAHSINLRNEKHYSNIRYNSKTEIIDLQEINVGSNTFDKIIAGNIKKIPQRFEEECDIYISDAGIYLPSHYHNDLEKLYPTMPTYFALSRHLSNHNVHCNSQNKGRVWDKLREQADSYIWVRGNKKNAIT